MSISIITAVNTADSVVTLSNATRLLTVTFALVFAFAVFELIRRRKLQERYTVLWFVYALAIALIGIFPALLNIITDLLGIYDPNAALFALGFIGVGVLLLNLTVTVSKQGEQITRLAQEVALLHKQLQKQEKELRRDLRHRSSD